MTLKEKRVSNVSLFQLWISAMHVISAACDVPQETGASIQDQHAIFFTLLQGVFNVREAEIH